ncbi:alginate export family protein [Pseudomonas sp. RIT-PI-S]|uniref:alginate export family protein n=1 Tax=Pseudomonas sp. RIT-PI-S TaxID=3035295 RepID=UPI0021D88A08|nr:alginate export family protein [Pseudomonas sp. RIT-PI-S]
MAPSPVARALAAALCLFGSAQPLLAAGSSLEQSRPSRPGAPRWNEDYRFLDDPAKRTDPFDNYRYLRLSDSAWVQFGGELRYRADALDRPFFGLRGIKDDSYLMQRLQAHADLHLLDDAVRAFVQVQNTRVFGKDLYSPSDAGRTELSQAFIDFNGALGSHRLTTRVGRQEMGYGNQVLITYRDTPNVRQSFDGLRATLALGPGSQVDAFAVHPVAVDATDSFDDGSDNAVKFYGLYATLPVAGPLNADLYGLGLETRERTLDGITGAEKRYSVGTRLFGQAAGFDWSTDLVGQFGQLHGADIRAWALSSDTGYTFAGALRPRLGLRIDVASGDGQAGDGRVGTFDPLYPRNGVYGEASLTTLANIIVVGPTLGFSPHPRLRLEPGVFAVWKQNPDDGVYMPGMSMLPGTRDSGRHLGTIYRANLRWLASANTTVDLDCKYYAVGSAITEAGGDDASFVALRGTFRF